MKKIILFSIVTCIAVTLFSQNYSIGHRSMAWTDSARNNRAVHFEVYYPSATAGDNVPVITGTKKFPLVVFGHGYQLTYSDYSWLKDSLVSKGFFIVFPRTEEQLFPSHTDFAKDYAFLIETFDLTKKIKNNWYYKRIKNAYAVGGHSMGGGCSLLSVQYSSKIKAVFNFAAAETNPSAIDACKGINLPALLFAGGRDCISPPASNQLPMYNNIQNACKTYIQITAAKHCQWADNGSKCRAGEFFCSPAGSSSKETLATTFALLYPWLNSKLNLNENAGKKFQRLLMATTGITYQQSCNENLFAGIQANKINTNNALKIYPSAAVAGAFINISYPQLQSKSLLQITNYSGKLIYKKTIVQLNAGNISISSAGLQKGIYFIMLKDNEILYRKSFVIE